MQLVLLPIGTPPPVTGLTLYNTNPGPGTPNYTRNGKTQFSYTWDDHGKITAIGGGPTNCNIS
jgi:hypothetical protein